MATIALYANTLNQMPALISDIKQSVSAYKSDLFSLRQKALNVKKSICDLDDVIASIQTSTQTQEEKIEKLETLSQNCEAFAADAVRADAAVTDTINQNKADFYEAYDYLKPDSEKTGWEKFCDTMSAVGDWCKEHWKLLAAIALVIAAVAVIILTAGAALGPVLALCVAAAKGIIIGAIVGGLTGGLISGLIALSSGKSFGAGFLNGFEEGAFSGAISGALTGGLGSWLSGAGQLSLSLGKTMLIGGIGDAAASMIGDVGDILIKQEDISVGEFFFNAVFCFGIGSLSVGGSQYLSNKFPLKIDGINKGRGSWAHVWKTQASRSLNRGSRVQLKTILKGLGADILDGVWDYGFEMPKNVVSELKDRLGLFAQPA